MNRFAANLKYYRTKAGLSQAELAGKIDLDERQIRYYEHAENAPNAVHLYRMAQVFKIKLDDFFKK
ncbi:helix-turn-helix domain-containing protein [Tunicatimonas pelagia]|uniref:helix-turn-helix domain-containing protein n=1 Tax=Tunicatimonas pelagia TaxID=931531 RepID=UPI0026667E07|nr:helix-turn-helix transcriptional regulator [Tunicatimonas pelagia]WKN46522.1 helix-turn-helix transcriptional regulator [Tunicatimonas pelagia]